MTLKHHQNTLKHPGKEPNVLALFRVQLFPQVREQPSLAERGFCKEVRCGEGPRASQPSVECLHTVFGVS